MHNVRSRIFVLIASTSFAMAESPPGTAPSQLPPRTRSVENVVVPIPSEIFGSLEKFAHSNWRVVERPELADWRPHGNPEEIALLLGVEVAEGFIAVEAEDATEVKSIGSVVLRLARGLGVRGSVLRRSRSITEDASKNDWTAARKEWDGVLPDVKKGMVELKSDQLAQLVSLGGWLRGTEALSVFALARLLRRTRRAAAATCVARLLGETTCRNEQRGTDQPINWQDAGRHTRNPAARRQWGRANFQERHPKDERHLRKAR
jgi:hypothetical protein